MDRIDAMRAFVRVVERRSFALAAQDLALPRSRVTEAVQRLEGRLGVRLLVRTTRRVAPTAEGEEYCRRCLAALSAVEDADAAVMAAAPGGPLRVDLQGTLARHYLLPSLPAFLERHPGVELHIAEGERLIDMIEEGIDCVLRVGRPADSGLVGRRLGALREGTYASPAYLERHGLPATLDDLAGHRMVGFLSTGTRAVIPLEFQTADGLVTRTLPLSATVTAAATYAHLARLGLGLIQIPCYHAAGFLAGGELVEVLPDLPPRSSPVYVLYPEGRPLSPRVRAFIDWMQDTFRGQLDAETGQARTRSVAAAMAARYDGIEAGRGSGSRRNLDPRSPRPEEAGPMSGAPTATPERCPGAACAHSAACARRGVAPRGMIRGATGPGRIVSEAQLGPTRLARGNRSGRANRCARQNGEPGRPTPGALSREVGRSSGMTSWRRAREWRNARSQGRARPVLLDRLGPADAIGGRRACLKSASKFARPALPQAMARGCPGGTSGSAAWTWSWDQMADCSKPPLTSGFGSAAAWASVTAQPTRSSSLWAAKARSRGPKGPPGAGSLPQCRRGVGARKRGNEALDAGSGIPPP